MRGDFIEQQQARAALRGKTGMRQGHCDQHCFLFAGRAVRGGYALGSMDHVELVAMGSLQCALRRAVAPAIIEQRLRQAIGMVGCCGHIGQGGPGKRLGGHLSQPYRERFDQPGAALHQRGAMLHHLRFDCVEPAAFGFTQV